MFDNVQIPADLVPAYREQQTERLRFNLRAALLFGAPVSLFYLLWESRHDPEGTLPGTEIIVGLSVFLIAMFLLTYVTPSRRALGAITIVATITSISVVVGVHSMLTDVLSGTGVLLIVLVVTTVLAIDLGMVLTICLSLIYLAVPNIALYLTDSPEMIALDTNWVIIPGVLLSFGMAYLMDRAHRRSFMLEVQLAQEKERSEELLRALLPARIAEELKRSDDYVAEVVPDASVLFADLVGFTPLTQKLSGEELISILTEVFTRLDEVTAKYRLEKIKTIGDAYMVGAGVADATGRNSIDIAEFALDARSTVQDFVRSSGYPLDLRIGVSGGQVVSGVIGRRKPHYDVWGATVNLASRLESTAPSGCIQVDTACAKALEDRFELKPRGKVMLEGLGMVDTYLLIGRKSS